MAKPTGIRTVETGKEGQTDMEYHNVSEIYPGATAGYLVRESGRLRRRDNELGMATAEYAICTLAAVGFAGLLVVILKSDEVRGFLLGIIRTALSLP